MNILEEFYYGNITPGDFHINKGSEYDVALKKLCSYTEELFPTLNKEQKRLFEKIELSATEMNGISEKERFIKGFRLGVQIISAVFLLDSSNFSDIT